MSCSIFSKHPLKSSDLNKDTAEQLFNHTVRCVPMDRAPVRLVILEEFERCVSADVRAFLKGSLDAGVEAEDGGLPNQCVVVATSNDSSKIEPALLERFSLIPFSGGPEFALACQERLAAIWESPAAVSRPAGRSCRGPDLLVLGDTSGSMNDRDLGMVLGVVADVSRRLGVNGELDV